MAQHRSLDAGRSLWFILLALLALGTVTPCRAGFCNTSASMTTGRWQAGALPVWYDETCPYISPNFKCSASASASRYTWMPNTCTLAQFKPLTFAYRYRGKTILVVGDSVMKNFYEALLCALAKKTRVPPVDTKGSRTDVSKHFTFPGFGNLKLILVNDNYLVNDFTSPTPAVSMSWRPLLSAAALSIFTTGHWFTHNGATTEIASARIETVTRAFGAYLRSQWAAGWTGKVVFMTYTPVHKVCKGVPAPYTPAEYLAVLPKDRSRKFTAAIRRGLVGSAAVKILDVTDMALWRADAHGPNDCSHWCTPGIPNVWLSMMTTLGA